MGHGMKALALAAILLTQSTTAEAVAWKVKGYFQFWMEIEEVGFSGEALLKYSGRLTAREIEEQYEYEGSLFLFEDVHGLTGSDRISNGHWTPIVVTAETDSPSVALYVDSDCYLPDYPECRTLPRDFLLPVGAANWGGAGQFDWFRVTGEGTYAWLTHDGVRYECDWEYGCQAGPDASDPDSYHPFNYWWDAYGTFTEVPEPALPVLLSIGLFGITFARRRRR